MDLLQFIDSPDIREYNKDTCFTPAEWAVLIGMSHKRTMEEKMEALQYLLDHFDENAFMEESRNIEPRTNPDYIMLPSRQIVTETVRIWQDVLRDRYDDEGFLYAARYYSKKEYSRGDMSDYVFFSNYEKAYAYLESEKKEYLEDEDMCEIERSGRMYRIRLDEEGRCCENEDLYMFDADLRLVDVMPGNEKNLWDEEGRYIPLLNEYEYRIYVPLPFKEGDIVKVESLYQETYYGVLSHDWKRPAPDGLVKMWLSLEVYYEKTGDFDFTDGSGDCILGYSYCREEELPDDQQVLKLISDVHKGKLDFYLLLHKYGRKELDQLLKWRS